MTRKELYDYLVKKCKCSQFPPNEFGNANCIGIHNPNTGRDAFFDTPIDDRRMKDFTIGQICSQLGLEPPPGLEHIKPVVDEIANTDFSGFPPKKKDDKQGGEILN